MHSDPIITTTIFFGLFFASVSIIYILSEKLSFPYTAALLVFGIISQLVIEHFGFDNALSLAPNFIYFILLPLLLFDSAMKINFHQFRLHFKTITFLTTFGLMFSVFVIGVATSLVLGIPLVYGLLFGAIVSSTDPIAVVAIFKSLRAPKRLSLLIEGESMFNDATAVILFRFIAAMVIGTAAFSYTDVLMSLSNFIYIFVGSIVFGAAMGYLSTQIIKKIDNNHIIESTITVALALSVFIIAEHYLGLSGVIATVIAGLVVGNTGKTAISPEVQGFIHNLWEYIGFVVVSLVFFFATFSLNIRFFASDIANIAVVVLTTIAARAISVYLTFFITNRASFFKNEPNVPLSWQHILNWGGLRGVIPLVLVYSLPDSFDYKEELINFTMAVFLFSLFINGTTIKSLIFALGVHLPKKEQEIISEEENIFEVENARRQLDKISDEEIDYSVKAKIRKELANLESRYKKHLMELTSQEEFLRSLKYLSLEIERKALDDLFVNGSVGESAYYAFETQLDLQMDALEYPEVDIGRGVAKGGQLATREAFWVRLSRLQKAGERFLFLRRLSKERQKEEIMDRISFLRARIISSKKVIDYFCKLEKLFAKNKNELNLVRVIKAEHIEHIDYNKKQEQILSDKYPEIAKEFQEKYAHSIIGV